MKKNFKIIILGILLIVGLNMVGCQSTQDIEELQELEKVKIEIESNKEEKDIDEKKEETKKEGSTEKVNKEKVKEEETGQCYDCGEYYPVKNMTFNGRSYHCGCVEKRIICGYCDEEGHVEDDCMWKEYDEELGDDWICSICGRTNTGQVLCECEQEIN